MNSRKYPSFFQLMWRGGSDLVLPYYFVILVKIHVGSNGLSFIACIIAYNHQDKLFKMGLRG
jgi:hypothetical protein